MVDALGNPVGFQLTGGNAHDLAGADAFLPVGPALLPDGGPAPVAGTPFDFTVSRAIGERLGADDPQLRLAGGYDHNFILASGGGALASAARLHEPEMLRVAYNSLRPYGGTMWVPTSAEAQTGFKQLVETAKLERAKVTAAEGHLLVTREGALPDAADWTHQYGDVGNTVKSDQFTTRGTAKRPSGMALKLLAVVEKHGLKVLA